MRIMILAALALVTMTAASCGKTADGPREPPDADSYAYGNIDGLKLRIPRSMLLSQVSSDLDSLWKPAKPEQNTFERNIAIFELKLFEVLPNSSNESIFEVSLNSRGFVEVGVFREKPENYLRPAYRLIAADIEGRGAGKPYIRQPDLVGFRHWKLAPHPIESGSDSDLLVDDRAGLAVRCKGGEAFMVRKRGICEELFYIPRYHLSVGASFSGADLADARIIQDQITRTIQSFIVP